MKFSDKLPKLRKDNNLSQEQLADRLGVSRQAVSKWELGSSYPDMEKIIQLCKILNCSLDDLIDDAATGNKKSTKESKININEWIEDFLNFITKTYNMFCNMTFIEKIKCLLEIGLIILFIFIGFSLVGMLFRETTSRILYLLPDKLYRLIINIGEVLYSIIGIVLGFIITLHLFKIRYLNYFITIEDERINKQVIEDPIDKSTLEKKEKNFIERPKEKIIIRDPKHSKFSFLDMLARILIFFIKMLAVVIGVFAVLSFIGLAFSETVSLWLLKNGPIFSGTTITLLGLLILNYLVIEIIYNLVLSRKQNLKRIFIMFVASLVTVGVGFGISFCSYLAFTPIENNEKQTTLSIPMSDNLILQFINDDIIIDNTLKDIKVVIKHSEYTKVNNSYYEDYNKYLFYDIFTTYEPNAFIDITNQFINDFKNKKARNYNLEESEIMTISMSEANLNKIKENYNEFSKIE